MRAFCIKELFLQFDMNDFFFFCKLLTLAWYFEKLKKLTPRAIFRAGVSDGECYFRSPRGPATPLLCPGEKETK